MKNINYRKIIIGAVIAGSGAALTYLTQFVSDTNFGLWTPAITALMAVLVNAFRKWKQGEEG